MIKKIEILLSYCKINDIIIQQSKCKFIVINGTQEDKEAIPFVMGSKIEVNDNLDILGAFISEDMTESNNNHMKKTLQKCHQVL